MIRIVELNTMSREGPILHKHYFEEFPTIWERCNKCNYWLYSSDNYNYNYNYVDSDSKFHKNWTQLINETHIELCEGDPHKTLVKVNEMWKEYVTRPQQEQEKI